MPWVLAQVGDHPGVIRHALAPVVPSAARGLGLPRTVLAVPDAVPWVSPGAASGAALGAASGVALTFDDGPHPEGTPAVLEILDRAGVSATFFLVGEQVQRRPALAAEIVAAGHLVALHGHRHRLQLRLSAAEIAVDLRRGAAAIVDATAVQPAWHRPPYGIYSSAGLRETAAAGLRPLLWSRWGRDWRKYTTPARIARRATANVHGGDVILLHDADFYSSRQSHRRTAAALPLIIAELGRRGLGTVLPV
ncbi:MAG: polysaccharide deacetylase family protein [Solirubrobacteraceae bacterium]